jgi:hypothetical protein
MNRSFSGQITELNKQVAMEIFDQPQHRDIARIKDGVYTILSTTRKDLHTIIKLGRAEIKKGSTIDENVIQALVDEAVTLLNKRSKADCQTCHYSGDFVVPLHNTEFAVQDCNIPRIKDGKYHNKYNPICMKNVRGECRDWKKK